MFLYTLLKYKINVWDEFKMIWLNLIECYFSRCFVLSELFYQILLYINLFWFSVMSVFFSPVFWPLKFEPILLQPHLFYIKFSLRNSPSTGNFMTSVRCCNYFSSQCFSIFFFQIDRWLAFEILFWYFTEFLRLLYLLKMLHMKYSFLSKT